MNPEISEFSYGFALTNEIVGWAPLRAAPVFPSLIEEGKAGGGYDVKLDMPAVPLYLQFKRADCMKRATAREVSVYNLPISLPFYRFKIAESGKSDQHELLRSLAETSALVYYAAPRFHEYAEINYAWSNNLVAARSIFVSPTDIGELDDEAHHVAYDGARAWLCSEPKHLSFFESGDLLEKITARMEVDGRALGDKLPEMVDDIVAAEERARVRIYERHGLAFGVQDSVEPREVQRPIETRSARELSDAQRQLRMISDRAGRVFDAQLVIAQPKAD